MKDAKAEAKENVKDFKADSKDAKKALNDQTKAVQQAQTALDDANSALAADPTNETLIQAVTDAQATLDYENQLQALLQQAYDDSQV